MACTAKPLGCAHEYENLRPTAELPLGGADHLSWEGTV